ncbi:hypothetical protein MMC13_004006 [Lambiella insularis]|nr:hypothetical protein [Lambiella insularis]
MLSLEDGTSKGFPESRDHQLQLISDLALTLESPMLNALATSTQSAPSRTKYINQVIKVDPSLTAAAFLLPPLTQVSEAVTDITSTFDPTVSTLLTFGTAFRDGDKRSESNYVSVVAVAGGLAGECVRLLPLGEDRLCWDGHKGVQLVAPAIDNSRQGWWTANGGPIQQICFSEDNGRPGALLAVRHPGTTSILRPLAQRQYANLKMAKNDYTALSQSSYLDPNPVVRLPIQSTGGALHVDLTFNPWDQNQLAVIDVLSRWSVWKIENRMGKRDRCSVVAISSGVLPEFVDNETSGDGADGWGKILWVRDVTTIVVANRKLIAIYDTVSAVEQSKGPDLGFQDGSHWILDIKRSPIDSTHIFVLSSLCIHWLKFSHTEEHYEGSEPAVCVNILLARQHFWNPEDSSLQMVLCAREGEIMVVLHSSRSELVPTFCFSMIRSLQLPQSVSDPFVTSIGRDGPNNPIPIARAKTVATMHVAPVKYAILDDAKHFEPGSILMDNGIYFYKIFVLYKDLSVKERLYAFTNHGQELKEYDLPQIIPLVSGKASAPRDEESFVIQDSIPIGLPGSGLATLVAKSTDALSTLTPRVHDRWTSNFEWLALDAEKMLAKQDTSAVGFLEAVKDVLKYLTGDSTNRIWSLNELVVKVPMISTDDASGPWKDFLNGVYDGSTIADSNDIENVLLDRQLRTWSLLAQGNPVATGCRADGYSELMFTPLYENLLVKWIGSLGSNVQGRLRVSAEKRLRIVSVRLYLSSYGLQYESNVKEQDMVATLISNENNEFTLPLRRKSSVPRLSRKEKDKVQDILPDRPFQTGSWDSSPSASAALTKPESSLSVNSQQSTSLASGSISSPYNRLRAFAPLGSQPAPSESLMRLIGHWTVGNNPKDYDWAETQERLNPKTDAEEEGKRKSERRLKKHKRHGVDTQGDSSLADSPRPWTDVFSSQIAAPQIQVGSSQLAVPPVSSSGLEYAAKKIGTPKRRKAGF